jgi:hypothetical protein
MSSTFGLDQSNRLIFVSEASRGLACQCKCVVCLEPLIARQGAVREHHFAHVSGKEPCEASHESLLHRYAKQVIHESGGLIVPLDFEVAKAVGVDSALVPVTRLPLPRLELEKALEGIRPDLLGYTDQGVAVAIEIAYSSFCDVLKIDQFAQLNLPALEIDLREFTPSVFEPNEVRTAVLQRIDGKAWLWPRPTDNDCSVRQSSPPACPEPLIESKTPLPEEIVTISGRWVSIKEFPSGDIAVKVVKYDPDVVSLVRSIAKANHAQYAPKWRSWNVPRWRAEAVRAALRSKARSVSIVLRDEN